MGYLNKAMVMGNLGQDPQVKFLEKGNAVCNFSLATTESWKDKTSGEKMEKTEWHRVSCFGKTAELCGQYLKKGRSCLVEGRLQTRSWEKDGAKHYTTEIIADRVTFIGGGKGGEAAETGTSEAAGDDGIPF